MAIDFHQEFNAMLPHVIAVRDAVSGSIAVKSKNIPICRTRRRLKNQVIHK